MSRSIIVITRPLPEALIMEKAYKAKGYASLIAPMVNIILRKESRMALEGWRSSPPKALWVTSHNSLQALRDCAFLFSTPLIAVGDRTAQEAKNIGFLQVTSCAGNAEMMINYIEKTYHANMGQFLYLSGSRVSKDLALYFTQKGWKVTRLITYDTQPVKEMPPLLQKTLKEGAIYGMTFFSKYTAESVIQCMRKEEVKEIYAYSLSENITKTLACLPWKGIITAKLPNQAAFLALF